MDLLCLGLNIFSPQHATFHHSDIAKDNHAIVWEVESYLLLSEDPFATFLPSLGIDLVLDHLARHLGGF